MGVNCSIHVCSLPLSLFAGTIHSSMDRACCLYVLQSVVGLGPPELFILFLCVQVNGEGEEIRLPVSLLLSHAFYNYFSTTSNGSTPPISSLHLSTNSGTPSLEDRPHPLLLLPQTSLMCPLTRVLVEAPVCDSVTRSVVEIERRGFLESVDHELLPWLNCHVMSDSLPADVFLRLGESYVFTVHLHLNPLLAGVSHL